jgi:23S rRNA pseudouridine1911/1915/1917 synthase
VEIDAPLGAAGRHRVVVRANGRASVTHAWPLPTDTPEHAELLLRLVTGHRHQARAHLAWIGRPIVGDTAYGGPPARFLRLHAAALDLSATCPKEPCVHAPLPDGWDDDGPSDGPSDELAEPGPEDRADVGPDHRPDD